jgi:hypothetical protein
LLKTALASVLRDLTDQDLEKLGVIKVLGLERVRRGPQASGQFLMEERNK